MLIVKMDGGFEMSQNNRTIKCTKCGEEFNNLSQGEPAEPFVCSLCQINTGKEIITAAIRKSNTGFLVTLHGGPYVPNPRVERFSSPATLADIKAYYGSRFIWMQPHPEDDKDIIAVGI